MNEQMIVEMLHALIYAVITVILPIITTYAVKIMRAKLTEIRFDGMDNAHKVWIDRAMDNIEDIVLQVQQTYVSSLKNRGEFTPEAAKEAKEKAIEMANKLIAKELKNAIDDIYGSFDEWLDVQIEKNVLLNHTME